MPRGSRPGEHRGGRKKGGRNRATIERMERERLAKQVEDVKITDALAAAKVSRNKLAKEVLEDFMVLFAGIAGTHQPYPPAQPQNPNYDAEKFERFARLTVDAAKELAKYQSPQFRAIVVAPAPDAGKEQRRRFTLTIFEGRRPAMLEAPEPQDHDDVKH